MGSLDEQLESLISDFNSLKKEYEHVTSVSYVNNIKADAIDEAAMTLYDEMSISPQGKNELFSYANKLRSDVIG